MNCVDDVFRNLEDCIEENNRPIFVFAKAIQTVLVGRFTDKYRNVAIGGSVGLYLSLGKENERKIDDIDLFVFCDDTRSEYDAINSGFDVIIELINDVMNANNCRENIVKLSRQLSDELNERRYSFVSCENTKKQYKMLGIYQDMIGMESAVKLHIVFMDGSDNKILSYVHSGIVDKEYILTDKIFAAMYHLHNRNYDNCGKNVGDFVLSYLISQEQIDTKKFQQCLREAYGRYRLLYEDVKFGRLDVDKLLEERCLDLHWLIGKGITIIPIRSVFNGINDKLEEIGCK